METFAEAFDRAISKEPSLSPAKLDVASYRRQIENLGPKDASGESLIGTVWAEAWHRAAGEPFDSTQDRQEAGGRGRAT